MNLSNPSKFILIFVVSYFVLIGAHQIKAFRSIHNHMFIGLEQTIFNIFNPHVKIDLTTYTRTEGVPYKPESFDHSFKIFNKETIKKSRNKRTVKPISMLNASLDNTSIGPIVLFLSLLFATPVGWRRKMIYAAIGILLIYILIALKYSYMFYENIDSLNPNGLWGLLSNSYGNAFRSHEFLLLNVLFIWVLTSIRSKELKWFLS